jgi:hypothetical protein
MQHLLLQQLQRWLQYQQQVPAAVAGTALMAVMLHCLIGSCLAQVHLSHPAAAAVVQLLLLSQLVVVAAAPHHLLLLSTNSSSYQAMHLEALLLLLPLQLQLAALLLSLLQLQQAS